jgi:hypothetical protein
MNDLTDIYRTREWFESLAWQHRWIDFMVGWWVGTFGKPKSMIDYGAGDGWWAHAFKRIAPENPAFAVELDEIAAEFIPSGVEFIQHDLREPLGPLRRFGLVICLEVAEHMTKQEAHNALLQTLTQSTGDLLLFSAAQPGQPGTGHINLQSLDYWITAIEKWPYIKLSNERTAAVRRAFENIVPEGLAFLPRNLLVFARV